MRRFAGLEGANAAETWGFAIAIKKAWASGARPLQASLRFRNPWLYWSTIAIVLLALAILGYLSKIDPVLDDRVDVLAQYIPSGWMGDGVGDGRRTRITWGARILITQF